MVTGRKLVGSLSLTVLQSLCCIMAKDWFRSSNVDRGHRAGAQKYILSGPKSHVSASTYLFSPEPSIYLCVNERYFVNFLRTFCVIVLIEHKKMKD
jgi:hypothetical protein